MRSSIFLIVLSGLVFACGQSHAEHPAKRVAVVCDLGGVLLDTNTTAAFWHIGPWQYLNYYASSWPHTRSTKALLYQTLDRIWPRESCHFPACDNEGNTLPQIICDWLKGTPDTYYLLEYVTEQINSHPEYFINSAEQQLAKSLISLLFNPEIFINTRIFLAPGLQFIRECKEQGHELYLLSNWDSISFKILTEQAQDIFNLFDGILISGDCGLLKPDPAIFKLMLKKFNLNPCDCLYLDDQAENIIAAQKLGIRSVLIAQKSGLLAAWPDFSMAYNELEHAARA